MGTKGWIIFAGIAVAVLGGLIFLSNQGKIDVSGFDVNNVIAANDKDGNIGDRTFGKKDSKVVLIEYGDYQCPGCGSANPRVKALTKKYEDQIVFIFRNLPLTSMHPNARVAAATAEAAGQQGKYWEMHNLLYDSQNEWNTASTRERTGIFRGYAERLGLDLAKFDSDITSPAINQKISFDQAIFKATGYQQATPTFVINGELISQDVWGDDTAFDNLITDKLKAAGIELPEASKAE